MFDYLKRTCRKHFGKDREFYAVVHNLLGITPDNIDLYKLALIHRSASVMLPDGNPANNERLEFLGDAVLETIVSDFLFIEYPEQTEGFLTQMRSRIVSRASLDDISSRMGIDKYIVANFNGTYSHKHLNGNAFEALVGAVYLDKGYDFANRFVINGVLRRYVDLSDITTTEVDFKSRLIARIKGQVFTNCTNNSLNGLGVLKDSLNPCIEIRMIFLNRFKTLTTGIFTLKVIHEVKHLLLSLLIVLIKSLISLSLFFVDI